MTQKYIESLIANLNQAINDETKLINDIKDSLELEKSIIRKDYIDTLIPNLSDKVLEELESKYKFKFKKEKKFSFRDFSFKNKIKNTKSIETLRKELFDIFLDSEKWPDSIIASIKETEKKSLETNINVLDSLKLKLELIKRISNIDFEKLKEEIFLQLKTALNSFENGMDSFVIRRKELYSLHVFPENLNRTNLESWLWSSLMLKNSDLSRDILRISGKSAISS